jgi:catenin beta 1
MCNYLAKKVLAVCPHNKAVLVNCNAIQALSNHLISTSSNLSSGSQSHDILHNCLLTLRNLSDAATRLSGLDQLVINLLKLLSTSSDVTISTLVAQILSNLTCNNEVNKKVAVRNGAVEILLKVINAQVTYK